MFEKEATEKANEKYPIPRVCNELDFARNRKYEEGFTAGAEFGYNKAKEEDKEKIQKLKEFIKELCFSLNNSSTDPCEDLLIYNAEQFIKEIEEK